MKPAMRVVLRVAAPALVALLWEVAAAAQDALPPLPAPSAEPTAPSPSIPPPLPPAPAPQAPQPYPYAPPPSAAPGLSIPEPTHASKYSLWLGGSLGLLAYGGVLYNYVPTPSYHGPALEETTGNFIRPGLAAQLDAGARLAYRYIPYVIFERGFVGAGRRFSGTSTNAATYFAGLGFRYLAGNVHTVSFAGDISLGLRVLELSNGQQTWRTTDVEIIRLGFGADIRLSSYVTLTPMLTLSGGTFTDVSGNIQFAPNQRDGLTGPAYTSQIPSAWRQSYSVVVLGCSAHVDLFGK
jgi:hypothetical protein